MNTLKSSVTQNTKIVFRSVKPFPQWLQWQDLLHLYTSLPIRMTQFTANYDSPNKTYFKMVQITRGLFVFEQEGYFIASRVLQYCMTVGVMKNFYLGPSWVLRLCQSVSRWETLSISITVCRTFKKYQWKGTSLVSFFNWIYVNLRKALKKL